MRGGVVELSEGFEKVEGFLGRKFGGEVVVALAGWRCLDGVGLGEADPWEAVVERVWRTRKVCWYDADPQTEEALVLVVVEEVEELSWEMLDE